MKIAYFGLKTAFTCDLVEILKSLGDVEVGNVHSQLASDLSWVRLFDSRRYDLVVVTQPDAFHIIGEDHDNIVFLPLFDELRLRSRDIIEITWRRQQFARAKIVCLTSAMSCALSCHRIVHSCSQYYPNPLNYGSTRSVRRPKVLIAPDANIPFEPVLSLCKAYDILEVAMFSHADATQRGIGEDCISQESSPEMQLIKDFEHYSETKAQSSVVLLSAYGEMEILQVLEAMASEQCVVSTAGSIASDYISHGLNGLLYELGQKEIFVGRLKFDAIASNARESIARGHERWLANIAKLVDVLTAPKQLFRGHRLNAGMNPPIHVTQAKQPFVSIVTVCRNAVAELEQTILSVISQKVLTIEYVIQDGGSTDGTLNLIRKYEAYLSIESEYDAGPFDAMNRAVQRCHGEWVLFMNAGDRFSSDDALARMFAKVPEDADVIYGHHLHSRDNANILFRSSEFGISFERLRRGDFSHEWMKGIPGHQSTAARRALLLKRPFDLTYSIAADHDFLFSAYAGGAHFFNCDEIISVYASGGISMLSPELYWGDLERIGHKYGVAEKAVQFYGLMKPEFEKVHAKKVTAPVDVAEHLDLDWLALRGFCEPEGPYPQFGIPVIQWLNGPSAELVCKAARSGRYLFVLEYHNPLFEEQIARVLVRGNELVTKRLGKTSPNRSGVLSFLADLLEGPNSISLEFANYQPLGTDPRALALAMVELTIVRTL